MTAIASSAVPTSSLSRRSVTSELRALWAVARRDWIIFLRYPTWVVALVVWPVILPAIYIFGARALAGPDGAGLPLFARAAGTDDFVGYILVGTTVWGWQNATLWTIGLALRNEQWHGTLETNWLAPTRRFWFLLGSGLAQGAILAVMILVSALEFRLVFGLRLNGSPLAALAIFLASMPAIYGLGVIFASLVMAFSTPCRGPLSRWSGWCRCTLWARCSA